MIVNSTGPRLAVVTSHGRQQLHAHAGERVIDVLQRYGIPWSALSIYVVPAGGGPATLAPCLEKVVCDYTDADEVLLYFNRNVNPFMFAVSNFAVVESAAAEEDSTEYIYQDLSSSADAAPAYLKKLTPQECRAAVAEQVRVTIADTVPAGGQTSIVVGVSGGGDSNALLHGLAALERSDLSIHPVILMGIPDWDAGVPRAQELCKGYGFDLTVMDEREVQKLLDIHIDHRPLIDRFEQAFKGDDFEFMGTLLIRLALSKKAREIGARYIATGLNLEDVLCEAMYRVSSGLQVAGIPSRTIGDMTLLFPLWLCPKRLIDGCFPKYSLQNYDARYPCFSLGRNLYYSMVYTLQSSYPGMCERLARGFSAMSRDDNVQYRFNEQLGFHTEREVPFPLVRQFQKMLGRVSTLQ